MVKKNYPNYFEFYWLKKNLWRLYCFFLGFDRELVSKTLGHYQPLVCYCLDATGIDNHSSKEIRFPGYQIYRWGRKTSSIFEKKFHQYPSLITLRVNSLNKSHSVNLIYVNKQCDASYLKEYFKEDQDDIWLKLYHPGEKFIVNSFVTIEEL